MTATGEGCAMSTKGDDALAAAGKRAVVEATRLWGLDIFDPARSDTSPRANVSRDAISGMLKACGWTWEVPYKGDGQVEWCGIFVGACWRAAGLDPKWLATYFASTYRLDIWARYRSFNTAHPNPRPDAGPYRLICNLDQRSGSLPFTPRPGDILMIGDGSPEFGDHITLVHVHSVGSRQALRKVVQQSAAGASHAAA